MNTYLPLHTRLNPTYLHIPSPEHVPSILPAFPLPAFSSLRFRLRLLIVTPRFLLGFLRAFLPSFLRRLALLFHLLLVTLLAVFLIETLLSLLPVVRLFRFVYVRRFGGFVRVLVELPNQRVRSVFALSLIR